jgi:prolyl-tRNA synthetase
LKVSPQKLIKTLLYDVGPSTSLGTPPMSQLEGLRKDVVAVLIRGDHEVNEVKLARLVGAPALKLSSAQTIERMSKAPLGFTGPVKLNGVRLFADHAVMRIVNGVTGANQDQTHLINVNPGRDFHAHTVADLRLITAEDACPACGKGLSCVTAIEVGHVFKLGTKYSQAFGAAFQDPAGATKPMIMGCYGIGINRILAAAIEQRHDAEGIVWPAALAPFQVVVTVMEAEKAEYLQAGEAAYQALTAAGLSVLLDDREHSPGSKLKDADLVGIPVGVILGKAWQSGQQFEVRLRATKETLRVSRDALVEAVHKLLAPSPIAIGDGA